METVFLEGGEHPSTGDFHVARRVKRKSRPQMPGCPLSPISLYLPLWCQDFCCISRCVSWFQRTSGSPQPGPGKVGKVVGLQSLFRRVITLKGWRDTSGRVALNHILWVARSRTLNQTSLGKIERNFFL